MEVIKENLKDILIYLGSIKDIYSFVVFLIIIISVIVYMKWDSIFPFFKKIVLSDKDKAYDKNLKDLLTHSIFYKCEEIRQEVKEMEFTSHNKVDVVKTKLLHILIDCQLTVIKELLTCMLTDEANNTLSTTEMQNKSMTLKNNITDTYCLRAKNIFMYQIDEKISDEDAEFLLDAYAKYRRKFNSHFEVQMMGIVNNEAYKTNYQKVSVLLEVISMSLYSIPTQSKVAMDEVNGRFLKYANK